MTERTIWLAVAITAAALAFVTCHGCSCGIQYKVEIQHTDAGDWRARRIGTRPGWHGQIEKTLCRSPVDFNSYPNPLCKDVP